MVRGTLSKVTTRYRKEFPKLKLETQGTEGEIEMLRIVYPVIICMEPDSERFKWLFDNNPDVRFRPGILYQYQSLTKVCI